MGTRGKCRKSEVYKNSATSTSKTASGPAEPIG